MILGDPSSVDVGLMALQGAGSPHRDGCSSGGESAAKHLQFGSFFEAQMREIESLLEGQVRLTQVAGQVPISHIFSTRMVHVGTRPAQ